MNYSKTFRLFISSTFSDFKREREVLQTDVFPGIKEYALSKGYTFQPIDLRWGVGHEAQLDQKTLELCLEEVRSCKSYPYPNFLVMLGDRYGWVPLPYAIESIEFEEILEQVNDTEKEKLLGWYKEDLNQLPASYILRERTGDYEDYGTWTEVENEIRNILQSAVKSSRNINDEQKRKYFLSATEAEIIEGIIAFDHQTVFQSQFSEDVKQIDLGHVFGFFRDIDEDSAKGNKFIVGDKDYKEAQRVKDKVKNILTNICDPKNKISQLNKEDLDYSYIDEFKRETIKFLKQQIDEQKEHEDKQSFTPLQIEKENQQYFAEQKRKDFMETDGLRTLLDQIDQYINNEEESQPFIIHGSSGSGKSAVMAQAIREAEENKSKKLVYRFVGAGPNSNSMKEILLSLFSELGICLREEEEKKLVRKSLCFLIKEISDHPEIDKHEVKEELVDIAIEELCIHLKGLGYIKEELYSLLKEMNIDSKNEKAKTVLTKLVEELDMKFIRNCSIYNSSQHETCYLFDKPYKDISKRVSKAIMKTKEDILIFIDGVDQLKDDENFEWLPSALPSSVKLVISALKDENYKEDSRCFQSLKNKIDNLKEIPKFNEPLILVKALLKKDSRTLQRDQKACFLKQYRKVKIPLYISISVQEMKHLKSTDNVVNNPQNKREKQQSLKSTQRGIIEEFIVNLSKVYHHNAEFVQKVLGYIYASKDGLSESELLQLIATDEKFVEQMAPETWHENPTKELPIVHWSRLYNQIKPFLSLKTQDGEELMYFFHREFENVVRNLSSQKEEHEAIIKATQKLIEGNQDRPFYDNRWGKLYTRLIENYELSYFTECSSYISCIFKDKQKEFVSLIAKSVENNKWMEEFIQFLFSEINIDLQSDIINPVSSRQIICGEVCFHLTQFLFNDINDPYYLEALETLDYLYVFHEKANTIPHLLRNYPSSKLLFAYDREGYFDHYMEILASLAIECRKKYFLNLEVFFAQQLFFCSIGIDDRRAFLIDHYNTLIDNNLGYYFQSSTFLIKAYIGSNLFNDAIELLEENISIIENKNYRDEYVLRDIMQSIIAIEHKEDLNALKKRILSLSKKFEINNILTKQVDKIRNFGEPIWDSNKCLKKENLKVIVEQFSKNMGL